MRLVPAALGISLLMVASGAHAQFGGLLQGILGAATQQAANQGAQQAANAVVNAGQPGVRSGGLDAAQANAVAAVAGAIQPHDPEYQTLLAQSLAAVPLNQRAAMAPAIDVQVRQTIAARRLGYNLAPAGLAAPGVPVNPAIQQAAQNALAQGLAGRGAYAPGGVLTPGDTGKAAAAGALIQGLGSLFSRTPEPTAPATQSPAP